MDEFDIIKKSIAKKYTKNATSIYEGEARRGGRGGKLIKTSANASEFVAVSSTAEIGKYSPEPSTSASVVDERISSTSSAEEIISVSECSADEFLASKWKKPTESMFFLQHLVRQGFSPRRILSILYPSYSSGVPDDIPDLWILQLLKELCEQKNRQKLPQWNSFEDAVELFKRSRRILVITGAGVSVSCGIPDFRSENGVYARLRKDFPELPDPQSMFDIDFFRRNSAPFYNFAREIFPGQFRPSISHMFIKYLEEEGKLLRNYSQNIDTLERVAGISNLVECHGSFARSTCLDCSHELDSAHIREQVFAQKVAHCPKCKTGVMKPNIVFFGEDLDDTFHNQMGEDHDKLDLLVVVGSSLQVRPVSLIPFNIDPSIPQILINRELLAGYQADIKLLGTCDNILAQIALAMGGPMRDKMVQELRSRQKDHLHFVNGLLTKAESSPTDQPLLPRFITVEDFKQSIDRRKEEEEQTEWAAPPDVKRQKLANVENETGRSQATVKEKEAQNDAKDGIEDEKGQMTTKTTTVVTGNTNPATNEWEGNYVLVESKLLAPDSAILVPPNLNVFVGAELFYDRDQDTFVGRAGLKEMRVDEEELLREELCSSSAESSSSSRLSTSSSASTDYVRGGSVPPELERLDNRGDDGDGQKGRQTLEVVDGGARKAGSCPPTNKI